MDVLIFLFPILSVLMTESQAIREAAETTLDNKSLKDTGNILAILEEAPHRIRVENEKVIDAETALATGKHKLTIARSMATIRYQEEKNATLTKAKVDTDPEVIQWEVEVIRLNANVEKAKNNADAVENAWISARKLAGLDDRELQAIRGSTIRSPFQN
jgi:hypothetical protein